MVIVHTVPRAAAILFFNSFLYGIDASMIARMDAPLWEMSVGIVQTFILDWLIGAAAAVYNMGTR